MDKFTQLVKDLKTGKLSHIHLQNAYRQWIREREDIPDGIKDLLCGRNESYSGLIRQHFKLIQEIISSVELAYRRGKDNG